MVLFYIDESESPSTLTADSSDSDFYRLNWLRGWGLYRMWAWHPQKFCVITSDTPF